MRSRDGASLRAELRARTHKAHEALDAEMRQIGWTDRASYGRFLQLQHAARLPIERWVSSECPDDIRPPRQTHLIEQDLVALEMSCTARDDEFSLPEGADPIGLAWAIAGSSLGNKAILRDVERSQASADDIVALPKSFLADDDMTSFWNSLREKMECPALAEQLPAAALAALAVFNHFQATTSGMAAHGETQ